MFKPSQEAEVIELVTLYISQTDEKKYETFNKLYNLFVKNFKSDITYYERHNTELDKWEARALLEDVFLRVLFKTEKGEYEPSKFIAVLHTSIRNRMKKQLARDLSRQRKRNEKNFGGTVLSLDKPQADADGKTISYEVQDYSVNVEEDVCYRLQGTTKTDAQKKALVRWLLAKTDEKKRVSAETLVECEFNYRKAARKLGSHHQTVKRDVLGISKVYDANRFGEIEDWLVRPS